MHAIPATPPAPTRPGSLRLARAGRLALAAALCGFSTVGALPATSDEGAPAPSAALPATDNLHTEVRPVAEKIMTFLKAEQKDTVAIGAVKESSPLPLASSGGPGIQQALRDELQRNKLRVVPPEEASFIVDGDYRPARLEETGAVVLVLNFHLRNRAGAEVLEGDKAMSRGLGGDAAIASLTGLNVAPPIGGDRAARDDAIEKAIEKPDAATKGSLVRAAPESPYAVELLVKEEAGWTPSPVEEKEGRPFAPVPRGKSYAVRLHNDSAHDALVTLTIDGINMFQFSKTAHKQVLIPAKGTSDVRGWHIDNENSEEFLVTAYAQSAAASLDSKVDIGTVTATFSAAWKSDATPPADEPPSAHEFSRDASGTGRGVTIGSKYEEVTRRMGVVRASVSVRYSKD